MRTQANTLYRAVVLALGAGVSITAAPLMAQDRDTQGADSRERTTELEGVRVTGSRLRQVDIETSQPLTVIDRVDIENQGFETVADILQNDPTMGTPPSTLSSANNAGENVGGSYASMRRLGPQRTLVLINGQRMGTNTTGFADTSLIPASAVQRIEILRDGASSIYGSDAIAGVVNVITRTDFSGGTVDAYVGQFGQGDGQVKRGSFVFGHQGDRYSLTLGGEVRDNDPVWASDRDFSAYPRSHLHPTDSWGLNVGGFTTNANNRVPGLPNGVRVVLRPGGDPTNINDFVRQNTATGSCLPGQGATVEDGCVPGSTQDKYNGREFFTLRMPLTSHSVFGDLKFDLTDNMVWRTNLLYSERNTVALLGGTPGPPSNWEPTREGMSADSYFNPTGAPLRSWWRATNEVPRQWDRTLSTTRLATSLSGSGNWRGRYLDWDVGLLYSKNEMEQEGYGHINTVNLQKSVGPSFLNAQGRVQCGSAADPIPFSDCVPFNPFLQYGVEGDGGLSNNPELQDFLFQPFLNLGETTTRSLSANVATTLFSLPAGEVGIAAGVERRIEAGEYIPARVSTEGLVSALSAGPTSGSYSLNEAYVEMEFPLLADMPFARELTLNVASRYSDYSNFGDTTNNKFGVRWRPTDTLLLRATIADGFRAPTINDLHGGGSTTFPQFADPCDTVFGSSATNPETRANCRRDLGALADTYRQLGGGLNPVGQQPAATGVPFRRASNPDLLPETSKSRSVGLVWSPAFLSGFSATIDWWKVRIENTIVADNATSILYDCYVLGLDSRCESTEGTSFTRDPELGYISSLVFSSTNAGFREAEGYDYNLRYRWQTRGMGRFSAGLTGTYMVGNYNVATNEPRRAVSNVGMAANFRMRARASLTWDRGPFGMTFSTRYFSGLREACTYQIPGVMEDHLECNDIRYRPSANLPGEGVQSVIARQNRTGSNSFHDVQFRYRAPWNATIAIGANNVFEHYGPVMYSGPASTFPYHGNFDIGRFMYMKYTQRF